jgi:hypothetical protein
MAFAGDEQEKFFSNSNGNSFHYKSGGLNLPFMFEDGTLSLEEKKEIFKDYKRILNHLSPKMRRSIKKRSLKKDSNIKLEEALVFKGKYKKIPDGYENLYGIIGKNAAGIEYLIIPHELSDAYKTVIKLKISKKEVFDQLEDFIHFMNNLETREIPKLSDLLYLSKSADTLREDLASMTVESFRNGYGKYQYKMGSLFNFQGKNDDFKGQITSKMIVLHLNGDFVDEFPVVYDNGKWKIVIFIPGV